MKGLVVLLGMLNLTHGAVSLALEAPGVCMCKSRYDAVQAAAERVPGLKQGDVAEKTRSPVLAGDMTSVKCQSRWQPLGFTVDDTSGLVAGKNGWFRDRCWLNPSSSMIPSPIAPTGGQQAERRVRDLSQVTAW